MGVFGNVGGGGGGGRFRSDTKSGGERCKLPHWPQNLRKLGPAPHMRTLTLLGGGGGGGGNRSNPTLATGLPHTPTKLIDSRDRTASVRAQTRVAESQAGVRPVTGRPARSDKLMLLKNLLKIHG